MDFTRVISEVPQLTRGQVWCRSCGSTLAVKSAETMQRRGGWPKCCAMTMTIDSPEEQARLSAANAEER